MKEIGILTLDFFGHVVKSILALVAIVVTLVDMLVNPF